MCLNIESLISIHRDAATAHYFHLLNFILQVAFFYLHDSVVLSCSNPYKDGVKVSPLLCCPGSGNADASCHGGTDIFSFFLKKAKFKPAETASWYAEHFKSSINSQTNPADLFVKILDDLAQQFMATFHYFSPSLTAGCQLDRNGRWDRSGGKTNSCREKQSTYMHPRGYDARFYVTYGI